MSLPGEENYSHKAIFEGNPKDFDLENCLNEYFPNLKNKKSCKAAIKSYATYLGLGIIGIETGAGGQQTGSISIMIDDNPVDMGLLEDVKIRARTSAYLKHKITLFEHTQRPQIISVANLDAWINSGCVFEKNYPTFTSEMANLANRFLEIDRHSLADRQTILNKYFDIINSTPEFVAPRVNFAHFFRRFRLLPQALQSIRWALELAPEDRDAWITAACIYSDSGDWENAKECFINALSLSIGPSRQEVIEYLSRLP